MPSLNIRHRRALFIDYQTSAQWNLYLRDYIARILRNTGVETEGMAVGQSGNLQQEIGTLISTVAAAHEKFDFIFTLNRFPSNIAKLNAGGKDVDLFSQSQVPVVSWYIDNVGHHLPNMLTSPLPSEMPLFVDRSSMSTTQQAGFAIQSNSFFPMWGAERKAAFGDPTQRTIPIAFTGDLAAAEDPSSLGEKLQQESPNGTKVLLGILEEMKSDKGTRDGFHLCRDRTAEAGIPEMVYWVFLHADRWLRTHRRKAVLQRITSTPVVILGEVHDPDVANQPNVEVRGRTRLSDAEATLQQSRILIGDFANFVDGIELRPSIAAVNGCVFACEENTFVKSAVPGDAYLSLFGDPATVDARVVELIDDDARLIEMDSAFGTFYDAQLEKPLFSFG